MQSLQETSIRQVFSTLREKFTTTELTQLEQQLDRLLDSSETLDQLIVKAKETLANQNQQLTPAA
jgi:hypothetical protein